jgi:N-acetylglucosaminyldiphosphoundecaprenol N-acetyl-beta-D-mannosaminyltransferase
MAAKPVEPIGTHLSDAIPTKPESSIDLGPLCITNTDMPGALDILARAVLDGGHHSFCFCDANLLSSSVESKKLRRVIRGADAVFADGMALATLAKLHGVVPQGRVTGPSFMLAACEHGISRNWRHFFCGGAPGVAEKLAANLSTKFPGLQVAGIYSPPFRPMNLEEEAVLKHSIESSKTDLLWVGLGCPKQEYWIAQHIHRIKVSAMLAVGAAFDFHSGNRPWAPPIVRRLGLEWAFRMLTGGRRTLGRNIKCISKVAIYIVVDTILTFGKRD